MTYSYDPTQIKARGKDQMRFELGDTLTDGGADTCALADEEYEGILTDITDGKRAWLYAKLAVIEAVLFKMSYQVDTKIDVLQYNFSDRAAQWQKLYDKLKQEITASTAVPAMDGRAMRKPPYFHTEMQENPLAQEQYAPYSPFRKMTE
ncbi:MAG: hypothetical protein LBT88_01225 [Oscillospiraceae bacterium]|jgi:hypothetical protein|nr:hypothetical protein [Oscillospiraceae bacterium]